jgi:hypothetical protein
MAVGKRARGAMTARCATMSELTPQHILADLFDGVDPPHGVDLRMPNPEAVAEIVIQRLIDAGFVIKAAEY